MKKKSIFKLVKTMPLNTYHRKSCHKIHHPYNHIIVIKCLYATFNQLKKSKQTVSVQLRDST